MKADVPAAGPTAAPTATPTPTPTPTATPTPTPTKPPTATPKKPFFPKLAAIGAGSFINVKGAPAGSTCSVKAFLWSETTKQISGPNLAIPAVKPTAVTDAANGVSWDASKLNPQDSSTLLTAPSPSPSPGQKAIWMATCTNSAYEPTSRTAPSSSDFDR
jgi:hypothetical protein